MLFKKIHKYLGIHLQFKWENPSLSDLIGFILYIDRILKAVNFHENKLYSFLLSIYSHLFQFRVLYFEPISCLDICRY